MKPDFTIGERVRKYYRADDISCPATLLKTAAEIYDVELSPQNLFQK